MQLLLTINQKRTGVIINLTALFLIILSFELIKYDVIGSRGFGLSLIGLFLLITLVSFIYANGMTGAWKMSHQTIKKLDERQIQLVANAIRISYALFSIITLIIIYGYSNAGLAPTDVVIAASLLYLAHIFPASVISWTEKAV